MTADVSVVLIHGIGSQKPDWSTRFREALAGDLGGDADRVEMLDAYWAPLSTVHEALHPQFAPSRVGEQRLEDDTYARAARDFTRMLASEAGVPAAPLAFGPGDLIRAVKEKLATAEDIVADVGNYIARNGVRTAVQHTLHNVLARAGAAHDAGRVLLVAHSQGTIISYDVLRQAGDTCPGLRTWITMGCPLRKYCAFPLEWGKQQIGMPPSLKWLNLYDKKDIVGRDLQGLFDWERPQPVDQVVDNVANATNAHDHWANPQVVRTVVDEVRALLQST